jgi:hypothetical protein
MQPHRSLALLFALVALLALGAPVLAGGVAVVIPDEDGGVAVSAGDDATIGFTFLQHGVTPVDFGTTTVVVTDIASGESFRIVAQPVSGEAGKFEAAFTYPRAGWWTWHVEHQELLVQSQPTIVGIFGADGQIPGFYPEGRAMSPSDLVAQNLEQVRLERDALEAELAQVTAAAAANADRVAASEGRVPLAVTVVGIVAAALAGLGIGFGVSRLGDRPRRASAVREISVATLADAD